MLVFLGLNSFRLHAESRTLTNLVVGVAEGGISKAEVAVFVRGHARPRSRPGPSRA